MSYRELWELFYLYTLHYWRYDMSVFYVFSFCFCNYIFETRFLVICNIILLKYVLEKVAMQYEMKSL